MRIYQANPEPGCVITFMHRLTLRKVEGASHSSGENCFTKLALDKISVSLILCRRKSPKNFMPKTNPTSKHTYRITGYLYIL